MNTIEQFISQFRPVTTEGLIQAIGMLAPEYKLTAAFPQHWTLRPDQMIRLVDAGVIGMDGFRYQFRECAQDCWKRCNGR